MPSFTSVVIIHDAENPYDPPLVITQTIDGEVWEDDDAVTVIDNLLADGWKIQGVGNFVIGISICQNVLLSL